LLLALALAPCRCETEISSLLARYKAEPGNARLCLQIGVAYTQANQLEAAAEFYRKALTLDPALTPARKNLATVLWFLGRKQESEAEFLAVKKATPRDPVPELYLGLAAYERREFPSAIAHFENAGPLAQENPEVKPLVVETYLAAAQEFDRQQLPEKAYRAYARALEIDPSSEAGYVELARFASEHGNHEFALKALARGLDRMPASPKLLLQKGLTLALQGNFEQAAPILLQAGKFEPRWPLPLLALGVTQLQASRPAEAAATFAKAAQLSPQDSRTHYLRALALYRDGGESDPARRAEVVAAARRALALNGDDARARVLLARCYLADGKLEQAIEELERSLKADPRDATALYQLAMAYGKRGDTAGAERALKAYRDAKARSRKQESETIQLLRTVR